MSDEKNRHEAERWLSQARSDVDAARSSRSASRFEWACFQSQQAGEKALQAIWLRRGLDPWGHSLVRLVEDLPSEGSQAVKSLLPQARRLDKLYIPTRYPNGLPDLTPAEVYDESEAAAAIVDAQTVIQTAESLLVSMG